MKKRHSEEQIIRILQEAEAREVPIRDLCRQHNITEQIVYRWRNVYGGMDVAEARRLKELESENARLKRLVAEQMLVIDGLREFGRKNELPVGTSRGVGLADPAGVVTAQGVRVPGGEPARGRLCLAPAGEGSGGRRPADGGQPGGAALRLPPDGGVAVIELGPGASDVARPGIEHSPPPAAPPGVGQRHPAARIDPAQRGLEL